MKVAVVKKGCVACGSCVKGCPVRALSIDRGLYAVVDAGICVGCGRCAKACPAGIIDLVAKETLTHEKALV